VAPLDKAINDSSVVEGSMTDFRSGPMIATGRDLDVALDGPGFFAVEASGGVRFTRNGNFQLNAKGQLVTSEGLAVQGKKGTVLLPAGKVSISQNGEIQVNGNRVDKLKVIDFSDKRVLEKVGDSLFAKKDSAAKEEEVKDLIVRQGSLEQSNVNPIRQMTLMIMIMRQFESLQKAIQMVMNTVNEKTIDQVGRPVG
jgi:flagellar basal-body rod protein FlgF